MTSLRESLEAAGLSGPFSLRNDLETYPRSLKEVMRVLRLPPMRLDAEGYEEFWEKTEEDGQGIACLDRDTALITITEEVFLVESADSRFDEIQARFDVAHFSDQTSPHLDGCNHFGDLDYHDGLIFVVFQVVDKPGALFVCDRDFKLVGFTELDADARDSCCALHPWNRLLYLKDRDAPGQHLRAYDVSKYFELHQSGSNADWGGPVETPAVPHENIVLRDQAGEPASLRGDIQGMAFSPNGRLYITHWTAWENVVGWTFFTNYLSIYSSLTGRRMWFSEEIDFEGDGDEIEGISLVVPRGEIFLIQTDNDNEGDELYLHRFLPPADVIENGGGRVELVI